MNLAVLSPNPNDATSFYRAMGPLSSLMKSGFLDDLTVLDERTVSWWNIKHADVLLMQRPASPHHVAIARLACDMSIPLWVDYDDFLWEVPPSNPAHLLYNEKAQTCMNEICRMANVVTVSTDYLKSMIFDVNPDIRVIPNVWDPSLVAKDSKRLLRHNPRGGFMWRGSSTHQQDLYDVQPQIMRAMQEIPWGWTFCGMRPWFIFSAAKTVGGVPVYQEPLDIIQYFRWLSDVKPDCMVVPLHDDSFNRSKSNIAYLEGIAAGAITVAPDFEEWRRPGIINYKASDPDTIYDALALAHELSPQKREEMVYHAMLGSSTKFHIAKDQRKELLLDLMK